MAPKKGAAKKKAQPRAARTAKKTQAAEEAPIEDAPVEEAPEEDAPVEEADHGEVPKEDAPPDNARKEEAPHEEAPNDETPEEEVVATNGEEQDEAPAATKPEVKPTATDKASKKRKKAADFDEPQKAGRRSGRSAPKSQPSQQQLLNFMLSDQAEELCRPEDETQDSEERGDIRTYSSSVLNPFEELVCAVVLSRPISHRLGLRTIRTILNPPYDFTSAKKTKDAGSDKHIEAIYAARTQHKEKTAAEIGLIADVVLEKFTSKDDKEGTQMQKLRDDCDRDVMEERETLKSSIKGLGKTGLDIFFRRVQWLWDAAYPFIDDRTTESLYKLGLPREREDLQKAIEQHWSKLDSKHVAGDDEEMKKRRAFVTILERATGADLEDKTGALMEAAASAS